MHGLEARKAELISLLAETPQYVPDILPSTSQIYAKKISRNRLVHSGDGARKLDFL